MKAAEEFEDTKPKSSVGIVLSWDFTLVNTRSILREVAAGQESWRYFQKTSTGFAEAKKTGCRALSRDQQIRWNAMISIPNQCKAQRDAKQQWGRNCRNWKTCPGGICIFFSAAQLEHSALTNFQGLRDRFVYSTRIINRYTWLLFIYSSYLRQGIAFLNKPMSLIFTCRLPPAWALRL